MAQQNGVLAIADTDPWTCQKRSYWSWSRKRDCSIRRLQALVRRIVAGAKGTAGDLTGEADERIKKELGPQSERLRPAGARLDTSGCAVGA